MAHVSALEDAKDLLRAGVDGFGHVVRDKEIDQELIAMLRQRPNVFFVATLWGERNAIYGGKPAWLEEPLLRGPLSKEEIALLADGFSTSGITDSAQRLLRNVAALNHAGVRLGLGTDTGGVTGGGYFGLASLVELELLVKAGLTPSEAIVAGTRTSAGILALDALGTIATGKSAAFLVLDANPLDDIANTRKMSAVYLDGAEVARSASREQKSTGRSPSQH
jgi:imidazolonepropionase-like amidohydrolase